MMTQKNKLIQCVYCLLIGVFWQGTLKAQNLSVDAQALTGLLIPISLTSPQLTTASPKGVELRLMKQTSGNKDWHHWYKSPRFGVTFIHYDFRNEFLGKAYSLQGVGDFPLKQRKRHDWHLLVGYGVAYLTENYRKFRNRKNTYVGSQFNYSFELMLSYNYYLTPRLQLSAEAGIIHYSNAALQMPNGGINALSLGLGIKYRQNKPVENKVDTTFYKPKKWRWNISGAFGMLEQYPTGGRKYAVYNVNFLGEKRISRKVSWLLGVEAIYNNLYKEYIPDGKNQPEPALPGRAAVLTGMDILVGQMAIMIQAGVYVYKPQPFDAVWYNKYGFKWRFYRELFTSFAIKTQLGAADNFELGLGYRF
ncbi:acyloxyacyl hydrolase [Microscilla marina]|uniref:Uncharacterized protein n=1 Tax=Microscilla marina ATCC 23134 TaxID=313606 RepID=A1ZJQ7_MICM2|nr:acyloxyacyl hydrolase [Microscilla marina]EAY29360.1 hypothetical protein M23134_01416 [Microscilla marina ATCC 23134]